MRKIYKIDLKKSAVKAIESLSSVNKRRVWEAIGELSENPRPRGCKKISSAKIDRYRIRVGDYRVIYRIYDDRLLISVVRMAHRREVYRSI